MTADLDFREDEFMRRATRIISDNVLAAGRKDTREVVSGIREAVTKIETEQRLHVDEYRRTANGKGFPRCAERLARLEALEAGLASAESRLDEDRRKAEDRAVWLNRMIAAQAIGLVATIITAAMVWFLKTGGIG